ncbi:MAG: hypothetical protein V1806_11510 [Pseudomonadota bacterium]
MSPQLNASAGLLLPTVLGLYGIYSLLQNYSQPLALRMVIRMALALYPPFVVYGVLRWRLLERRRIWWLARLGPATLPMTVLEGA